MAAAPRATAPPILQSLLEKKGEGLHDQRKDFPIEKDRGKRADDQHQRKGFEGENEARAGALFVKRQGAPSEIAEDKGSPGGGRLVQDFDAVVQDLEYLPAYGDFQHDQGQCELNNDSGRYGPGLDPPPVLAERPGETRQDDQPQNPLQVHFHRPLPDFFKKSIAAVRCYHGG